MQNLFNVCLKCGEEPTYTGDHIVWVGPHKSKILSNTKTNGISFETSDSWLLDS